MNSTDRSLPIVDAHLDIAYNATRGRDPRKPAREQPVADNEIATVGLPDLRAGNVELICATLFAEPLSDHRPQGYRNADEAYAQAISQLDWYQQQERDGLMRIVKRVDNVVPSPSPRRGEGRGEGGKLEHETTDDADARPSPQPSPLAGRGSGAQPAIILMEGADPIRSLADVETFFNAGVRIVGLAWKRTRYAGGTGNPGPLTPEGRELVRELDRFGIIHDASHLAEESFWNLLDVTSGPIIASHSNCRAIVPGDRHLSDDMIRAIAHRNGVIGINFFDKFLLPPDEFGKRRATLNDVVHHIQHICDLTGSANHVGLGTDMDGGLGREQIPVEIETSADLPRVGDALATAGFCDDDLRAIVGRNWLDLFARALPGGSDSTLSSSA